MLAVPYFGYACVGTTGFIYWRVRGRRRAKYRKMRRSAAGSAAGRAATAAGAGAGRPGRSAERRPDEPDRTASDERPASTAGEAPMSDASIGVRRLRMVEEQIVRRGLRDEDVLAAMRSVPRHLFVPVVAEDDAYADTPLPIGSGRPSRSPTWSR